LIRTSANLRFPLKGRNRIQRWYRMCERNLKTFTGKSKGAVISRFELVHHDVNGETGSLADVRDPSGSVWPLG
jgi:hypothetical protein